MPEFFNPQPGATYTAEFRAFAALPPAGAFDAAPITFSVPRSCRLTLFVEYTQGAAGGSVDVDIQTTPHGADQTAPALTWFSLSILGANAVITGAETRGQLEPFYINFDPTTGVREAIPIDLSFPSFVERVRVRCREIGAPATPGSCRVWGLLSPNDGADQGLMRLVQDDVNVTVITPVPTPLGLASAAAYVNAPAVNTAAVVTFAAAAGVRHTIDGIAFSYTGGLPVGGLLTITDNAVTVLTLDIPDEGPRSVTFPSGLRSAAANTIMVCTLSAGGAAITGKMNVIGYRAT